MGAPRAGDALLAVGAVVAVAAALAEGAAHAALAPLAAIAAQVVVLAGVSAAQPLELGGELGLGHRPSTISDGDAAVTFGATIRPANHVWADDSDATRPPRAGRRARGGLRSGGAGRRPLGPRGALPPPLQRRPDRPAPDLATGGGSPQAAPVPLGAAPHRQAARAAHQCTLGDRVLLPQGAARRTALRGPRRRLLRVEARRRGAAADLVPPPRRPPAAVRRPVGRGPFHRPDHHRQRRGVRGPRPHAGDPVAR